MSLVSLENFLEIHSRLMSLEISRLMSLGLSLDHPGKTSRLMRLG